MYKMHNKIKLAIIGFFMIAAGLVLFFTSNSLPHKAEVTSLEMVPILKWLIGVPLILAGLPLSAAGFLKNIGKRTIVITVVALIFAWFLFFELQNQ